MIKSDKEVLWRPGRVYVPQSEFSGWLGATTVRVGQGVGAPVEQEISTLSVVGAFLDTAGDELNHNMLLPSDLDVHQKVEVRIHFTTGSATAADTIAWKFFYTQIVPNVTTIIEPATALGAAIASMTVTGTAYSYQTTGWGQILPGVLSEKAEAILFKVELDAFAAGLTEDKFLLGVEFRYTPKRLQGPDGMSLPAKPTLAMLGKVY